jgi:multidrug efflux pump
MAIGTIFTLFVVPSVYVLVAKDHRKERERQQRVPAVPVDGEPLLPAQLPSS